MPTDLLVSALRMKRSCYCLPQRLPDASDTLNLPASANEDAEARWYGEETCVGSGFFVSLCQGSRWITSALIANRVDESLESLWTPTG